MDSLEINTRYTRSRTCAVCNNPFTGCRRVCNSCRYRLGKGLPVLVKTRREAALAGQIGRIHTEMAAIRRAGLDPDTATYAELGAAGLLA